MNKSMLTLITLTIDIAIKSAIPTPASPAPKNKNVWSLIFCLPASSKEAKIPARTTDAVP